MTMSHDYTNKLPVSGRKHCVVEDQSGSERPCVFPFKYKGRYFDGCTNFDYDKVWCATLLDNEGSYIDDQWGLCKDSSCYLDLNTTTYEVRKERLEVFFDEYLGGLGGKRCENCWHKKVSLYLTPRRKPNKLPMHKQLQM